MESAREESVEAATSQGLGVYDLCLDIGLFWPVSTIRQQQHHHQQQQHPFGQTIDNSTGLSLQGLARLNHRCRDGAVWDEIYLRHLKYACLRYVLGERPQQGLLKQQPDRALVLAVLTAATNSMDGRLAYEFVTQAVGPHAFDDAFRRPKMRISWGVAITLLVLVNGHARVTHIIEKYNTIRSVWEAILGSWPQLPKQQRRPLPSTVSRRVVNFLRYNMNVDFVLECLNKGETHQSLEEDTLAARLYLELVVKTQDSVRPDIFWGINLLAPLLPRISGGIHSASFLSEETRDFMCSTVLKTACVALESVPSPDMSVLVNDFNIRDNNHPLPLGVPEEFSNREDINGLLYKHRALQRKRSIHSYEAVTARKIVYTTMVDCFRIRGVPAKDPLAAPIVLFRCLSFEERSLLPLVAQTLEQMVEYFAKLTENYPVDWKCRRNLVAPLVPGLICAAASASIDVRNVAMQWSRDFLQNFDPDLARLLLAFVDDTREVSEIILTNNSDDCVGIVDSERQVTVGTNTGRNVILCAILQKVKMACDSMSVSP